MSCRAAIIAATCEGRYRNLPYICGLVSKFMFFWDSPHEKIARALIDVCN